jgi:hypothetical protein
MNSTLPLGSQTPLNQYLPFDAESSSDSTQTPARARQSDCISFGNIGKHENVQIGQSKALPTEQAKSSSGVGCGISVTDILKDIVSLILKLFITLQGGSDEASDESTQLPVRLTSERLPPIEGHDAAGTGVPSLSKAVSHATPQVDAQSKVATTTTVNAKSSVHAADGADPSKPPEGMSKDLWKDCLNACNRQGGDPFVLAAQLKQETQWGKDTSNAADGIAQVEANTRQAYASKFRESTGHEYDHTNQSDQVELAQLIKVSKGGDETNQLMKYNGGDNWTPGATDSLGRTIEADSYAQKVLASAEDLRRSAA